MSRIGKAPITVPSSVTVEVGDGKISVKGPQGTLSRVIPGQIMIRQEGETLMVERPNDERENRALHGLTRTLVANMVIGVTDGFTKELDIVGVGYRAQAKGPGSIELALGFSHAVHFDAPEGITFVDGHIVGLEGNDGLEKVTIETGGTRNTVPASALFVYVGQSPAAEFVPDSLARDATGHIVVDGDGRTSYPTVFAVGDVRAGGRQYLADAIADGQRAAEAIGAVLGKTS